mgnify:CR=1 FL=1
MEAMHQSFLSLYGQSEHATRLFFAPGRVNLIGEHTDYNGGHVLPCALTNGTYMAIRLRGDRNIQLYSENFSQLGILEMQVESHYVKTHDWTDYVKAVLHVMSANGYLPSNGFDIYVHGNIPNGAGLSSSASLELVTLVAMQGLFDFKMDPIEMVKLAKAAENQFIGVNCGIMDQFIIGMGKADHAVLLDTETLIYEYAPVRLTDYTLVIANTNKRRGLADSKYNERFSECREALARIQKHAPEVVSLGALSEVQFQDLTDIIGDGVLVKRARHAVLENLRTIEAHHVLQAGDLKRFGELMNESHQSLKEDYEVTGIELDTLVSLAQASPGVLGARMTGAGFGGCTVSLVQTDRVEGFIATVGKAYKEAIGYGADFYVASIGDGARELT